jgi:hypothetical protein
MRKRVVFDVGYVSSRARKAKQRVTIFFGNFIRRQHLRNAYRREHTISQE